MDDILILIYSLAVLSASFSVYLNLVHRYTNYVINLRNNDGFIVALLLVIVGLDLEIIREIAEMYG
ncbi:hypothetical protein [Vibrio phage vB_VpaP_SJSY21]|nr:hypothetical protein [Vibrio phage vB_VpaP_SJSY21]